MTTMLNKASTLKGYALKCLDGACGKVKDFYFDDRFWTIRYLVADTGGWLNGRQVLLSPYALGAVNGAEEEITVALTKKQIEGSPTVDSDKPVSHQFEEDYYGYYGWPSYWGGMHSWGPYPYLIRDRDKWAGYLRSERTWDPHLRSIRDVDGHHIQAADGEIGHVEDFILDHDTWAIRYLVVNTRNWWPGKKVLISPQWIERVSWSESKVFVDLSRESIKGSPEYTELSLFDRELETRLYHHYDRRAYWTEEPARDEIGALRG